MFKFLKLRNSVSGDARRLVPFGSIIHKHIIPLVLVFIFVLFTSVIPVSAVDIPLPPVWLPMNPYNSDALHNNYVLLNDDQKKIANEIIGAYGSVFLGLAANPLQNPIDTILNVRTWLQEYGSTFLNTIFDSTVQAPRAMQDLVGSVTYKASTYSTYDDYVSDTSPSVSSGSEKYFQFTPELTVAYKNWFAVYGDVYNWQNRIEPFKSNVTYITHNMSGVLKQQYDSNYVNMHVPVVRINENISGYSNSCLGNELYSQYSNIFVNTTNNTIGVYDNNGNALNNSLSNSTYISLWNNYSDVTFATGSFGRSTVLSYSPNNYSTYKELVQAYYDFQLSGRYTYLFYEDFVKHVYVGANWNSKEEIYNIDDLNIAASPSAYIDNVGDDAFVNINGLIGYLGSDVTDVREGVFENTLVREGDHAIELTDSILKAIDRAVEETKSGIVVPTNVFESLFDDGKGFISYMWYMTKPLVIYTRDLLDLLTFDPVDGFNASGPGYFILGVIGLGVIGGVIVKFLL